MESTRREHFTGDESGCRLARQWLARHLDGHPRADDIELVGSELVTNCIRHTASAGKSFSLVIETEPDGTRLTAEDLGSPGQPERRDPDDDDIHGHGLCLVDEVADGWGSDGDESGRDVWAWWGTFTGCRALGS